MGLSISKKESISRMKLKVLLSEWKKEKLVWQEVSITQEIVINWKNEFLFKIISPNNCGPIFILYTFDTWTIVSR